MVVGFINHTAETSLLGPVDGRATVAVSVIVHRFQQPHCKVAGLHRALIRIIPGLGVVCGLRIVLLGLLFAIWAKPGSAFAGEGSGPPPAPTNGQELTVALVPLQVNGEIIDSDRVTLIEHLTEGMQRGKFAVIGPAAVGEAAFEPEKCERARCFSRIATNTGATHVIKAVLTVNDRDYEVLVQLVDGKSGRVIAEGSSGCEICGITDVGTLLASEAAVLRTKLDALSQGPAVLKLATNPGGATVLLDGEIIGVTPLELPVSAGKHVLRVNLEGHMSVERDVTFVSGVEEKVAIKLEQIASRLPGRTWGYVSLGSGAGLLALGFGAVIVDQRPLKLCRDRNIVRDGFCHREWDTKWHAPIIAAAGGALATFGVAILLNRPSKANSSEKKKASSSKGRSATSLQTSLRVGPTGLAIQGSF